MATFNEKFKRARLDQSPYLFHFINGHDKNPGDTLQKILQEKQLISSKGYICFSASPITSIKRFFETKTKKTGQPIFLPWGLGFSRDLMIRDFSARNVIYTDGKENIPKHLKWRSDTLDVNSYDFEYLREWRIKGSTFDFSHFPQSNILVVTPDINSLNHLVVKFDMKFTPYVNYDSGDIEANWEEEFVRAWKGVSLDKLDNLCNDFVLSDAVHIAQNLGEDMVKKIFSTKDPI